MPRRNSMSHLSPEEKYQRRISARRKFKALVKLIIANLSWLQELEDDKLGDNVKKNIRVLTRKRGKKSMLTLADKTMLNKPSWARTEEELQHLRRIISRLKAFQRYPSEVKDQIPEIIHFNFFGPNRVILKQGYEPLNLYIILTGEVLVTQTYYDPLHKAEMTREVVVMGPGNIFGEVALLHNIERTATVTTTEASEFLYIRRDDFDKVLKDTVASHWAEMTENLSWFSYFQKFTKSDILETCVLSKKKFYDPDQLILSPTGGAQDCVYFVTKGICNLLESMVIKTTYKNGYPHYSLVKEESVSDDRHQATVYKDIKKLYKKAESQMVLTGPRTSLRPAISTSRPSLRPSFIFPEVQTHFLRVCSFKKLACFNVGESLKNRVVVAATDVECLVIPRYFLMEKSAVAFNTIRHFLMHRIPNSEQIFKKYVEEKKWNLYKQRLVDDILANRNINTGNNIHNVPYTIRLQEDLGEI